ncbi:GNAT family N-acetyltransferase [Scytonema sp. UIC 10036]|uniref:GNAT family N-acetyltransferase n=1 Tax=Scytonema sp. UIC 10036 TaxID=2304196 RepID=UPI0012DAA1AE|nr:GNAT family N-acetyltransferase [Scytonema sp. UIC 10036]
MFITYLAILPAYQRQGFGSQLVGNVLEQAAKRGIPVKLNVIRVNPGRAFYEGLGFKVTGGDKALLLMEWRSS